MVHPDQVIDDKHVLVPAAEKFPHAMVPGAETDAEVFEAWRANGLEPTQISPRDEIRKIVITQNPLTPDGKLTWECSPNMNGLAVLLEAVQAMVLMPALIIGDAVLSICEYFTKGEGRPDIGTGKAWVTVVFDEGQMAMKSYPPGNRMAAEELLATAFISMTAEDAQMPFENMARIVTRE